MDYTDRGPLCTVRHAGFWSPRRQLRRGGVFYGPFVLNEALLPLFLTDVDLLLMFSDYLPTAHKRAQVHRPAFAH